jgi:hypothetical protein
MTTTFALNRQTLHLDSTHMREALRTAEVELYCDHEGAALQALRHVRADLDAVPPAHPLHAALEAAVWSVRTHHTAEAHRVLRLMQDNLG